MREIKFRAWDLISKKMVQVIHFYNHNDVYPDYIFMQYTGLKDANGKEIYEGDIVEYRSYMQDEVKWQDDTSGFYPFADSPENCGCCGTGVNPKGSKVIGNIYENPELLNERTIN